MLQLATMSVMRRKSFEGMNCSVAQCLEVVGEWWTMLIVREAVIGVARFDDFQSRLGIARNVLTQRLDHLVGHGILIRVPYQEHPPRHEYRLTEKGRDLWPVLIAMRQWGDRWMAPEGPPIQMIHKGCGNLATAVLTCSACGEPVRAGDMRPFPGRAPGGEPRWTACRPGFRHQAVDRAIRHRGGTAGRCAKCPGSGSLPVTVD